MTFRKLRFLVPCMALFVSQLAVRAEEDPPGLRVMERQEADGVTLVAESAFNLEFTITLQCDLTNATASAPLPLTMDSAGRSSIAVVHIKRNDPALAWHYTYTFKWKPGGRRIETTNDAVYALPFAPGGSHRVVQGNFGKFSHFKGSQDEYAVDWEAPQGTIICAARAGVVTGVRQDLSAGGPDLKLKTAANFIIIKHDDGTFAEYMHIQKDGALVRLGDKVVTGQTIARSGNTGYTSAPHIHFAVFQTIDGSARMTLPTRYQTRFGIVSNLEQGLVY